MEREQLINHITEMRRRFESKLTPRQALVNMAKDVLRSRINDGSYDSRSTNTLDFIHIALDSEMQTFFNAVKFSKKVWIATTTALGEVRELTDYGKWLLEVRSHYIDSSDKQLDTILKEAIRKVGL